MGPYQITILLAIDAMSNNYSLASHTYESGILNYVREKKGLNIFIPQLRQALRKLRLKKFIEHDGTSLNHDSGKFRKLNKVTPEGKTMIANMSDVERGMFHEAD